ncbi:hypothetical protein ACFJGW_05155 [Burkholderiaceae bacterium UC74_6]
MTNKPTTMKSSPLPLNPLNSLEDWRRAEPTAAMQAATLAAARRALAQRRKLPTWLPRWLAPVVVWLPTRPLVWAGVSSCVLGLVGTVAVFTLSLPQQVAGAAEFSSSAFVPLVPAERFEHALTQPAADGLSSTGQQESGGQPREGRAWVVTTEMPAERLALLGLPYDPSDAGQRVRAELLVRPNGEVLAVRLVP